MACTLHRTLHKRRRMTFMAFRVAPQFADSTAFYYAAHFVTSCNYRPSKSLENEWYGLFWL
jgi:hypothetical protein